MAERSAEDREAARLERERRRAKRSGDPEGLGSGLGLDAPRSEAEIFGHEPDQSSGIPGDHPTVVHSPSVETPDDHDTDSHELQVPPNTAEHELDQPPVEADGERASGTRRISRLDASSGRERKHRALRRPHSRRARPGGKGHSWIGRIVSLIPLVIALAAAWFAVELFQPFGTSPHGHVTVVIPPHSTSSQIGDLLAGKGVISSSFFFELRATLDGDRSDMRSGTYHLQLGMSYGAVLAALTKAPPAAKVSSLTISEGHTIQYVAKLLHQQHIKGSYVAATRSSKLLDPHKYGAPRHVPSLEGFLFPDTFQLVDPITVKALVDDQLHDFTKRFATINLSYARSKHLTAYDVLKIASLIEAEAASEKDRPLVASVIYNRLRDHMELQLDSTARYATGNFTKPLTASQLRSKSPYNTHTHFGLPPTPIDSPGLAAIQAAAHPAKSSYLYFFSKPCTDRTVFASSYSQFLSLLAKDKRTHCG
jgi:peptidoglycan lytic transglycosylase G